MSAADQFQFFNDSSVQWTEATTKNGQDFEVGVKKAEDVVESNVRAAVEGSREPFGIKVHWPLGDSTWKDTTDEVKSIAAITRYCLTNNGDSSWSYILKFTNTELYTYTFFDETGDSWTCNIYKNGDHYVRFNSAKSPTIVFITGN